MRVVQRTSVSRRLGLFGVVVGCAGLVGCSIEAGDAGGLSLSFGQVEAEAFHWEGAIPTGGTLEVKGVSGRIVAEPTTGAAEVSATRRARRSDPSRVTIEVVEHAGGVTVCAVYPGDDADEPNECRPGRGGRLGARRNDVSVDFAIRVPSGVHFTGRTVNGDVSAMDLDANVDVRSVNGEARFSTAGYGVARTVNGAIEGRLGRADWDGELEFETVNGSITLEFATDLDADVRMRTVNGSLDTDFPITTGGTITRRRLRGTIGAGGRDLTLTTVNGSIRLRRAM